jgi:hypothetical protein
MRLALIGCGLIGSKRVAAAKATTSSRCATPMASGARPVFKLIDLAMTAAPLPEPKLTPTGHDCQIAPWDALIVWKKSAVRRMPPVPPLISRGRGQRRRSAYG